MNTLLWSAEIVRGDQPGNPWLLENPSECYLEHAENVMDLSDYDWRQDLKLIADERKWILDDTAFKSVREAFIFLTQKGFFCSMENNSILEECSEAFGLPVGSAIIANSDGPFIAFWEGEVPECWVKTQLYHACLRCPVCKKGDCEGEPGRSIRNGCQVYQMYLMGDAAQK